MDGKNDNAKLEELMKDPTKEQELLEELGKSQLIMPVIYPEGIFGDPENMKVGDVIEPKEQVGFNINYITDNEGNKSIPLFTSDKMMEKVGLRSSAIVMYVPDLANMLKGAEENYKFITINPMTDVGVDLPVVAFIRLFGEDEEENEFLETLKGILEILEKHSIPLEENMMLFVRGEENFMKDQAVDGVFVPNIPFNVSTDQNFQKEWPYLNVLLMEAGKKIVYIGGTVEEDHYDTIIAPGTEFKIEKEVDEYTTIWKCGNQPFYDE